MPEPGDDLVVLPEIEVITRAAAEDNPKLRGDETKAKVGVLDHEDPGFEAHAEAAAAAAAASSISAHQRSALALAVSQKGPRENPRGSNCNKYSKYFGFGCQFWCADFVAYCLDKTGNQDQKVPWGYPSAVRNITAWGQRNGKIHSRPRMGDIFTYKDGSHTGFVLSAHGSGFMTIEGNTSGPGGCFYVASHSRDASSGLYFFVRAHF